MTGRAAVIAIAAAVIVGLVVRLAAWTGMVASDDLTHAYAAVHFWDDPIEHDMPDEPGSPYTVNARRLGVNAPLAAAVALAGPSEHSLGATVLVESLLGILACALWAGALGGRRAAILAAWLAAVLPVDVWHATIWLQDNLFAAVLAGSMAAAAWAVRRDSHRLWLVVGLGLGYLQYVKENAAIILVVLVLAGIVRSVRARRIDGGLLWLIAGAAVVHVVAALYFWHAVGDPTYYVRAWLGRQVGLEGDAAPRPFPHNLLRLGLYLGYHQVFGLGLLVAAGFGLRWLVRDAAPARLRNDLILVGVVQLLVLFHILRWGAWTQRYMMQLAPLVVVLGAVGVAAAWPKRSPRVRGALQAMIVLTTAVSLWLGVQQHGPQRADVVRRAYAELAKLAPPETFVYVVLGARPAHYTDRAFALLDGYRHQRWRTVQDPTTVSRGLVVYAHLERHPTRPQQPPGRRVFAASEPGGRQWIEIYEVGPAPLATEGR